MLGKIFLGKFWHWAMLAVATALLWLAGSNRFHVREFNWFVIAMLIGTCVVLLCLLRFTRPGEQITRDRIVEDVSE